VGKKAQSQGQKANHPQRFFHFLPSFGNKKIGIMEYWNDGILGE
jgi:hypothetical protein